MLVAINSLYMMFGKRAYTCVIMQHTSAVPSEQNVIENDTSRPETIIYTHTHTPLISLIILTAFVLKGIYVKYFH